MTPEKIGTEFQVNTYTASHQLNPSVTSLSDGGFVVTWTSYGQDGSGSGVYGQRYTASGQASGNEFKINTYTPALFMKVANFGTRSGLGGVLRQDALEILSIE